MKRNFIFLLLFALLSTPVALLAYSESSSGGDLAAQVTPAYPSPGQEVNVTLQGYGFDIDSSNIIWSIDGKLISQGIGYKTFSFKTSTAKVTTRLDIEVHSPDGQIITKSLVFYPNTVDLLWEAHTYTPPFYQGKALPTPGSEVKVVAIPDFIDRNGQTLSTKDLVFHWTKDGHYLPTLSGIGQDSLTFNLDTSGQASKISVEIINPLDSSSLAQSIIIPVYKPEVLFYEDRPLEGVDYNHALSGTYNLIKNEVSIKAEPYFFSFLLPLALNYQWSVNDNPINPTSVDPTLLTLRTQSNSGLSSNKINLNISNPQSLFQTASNFFTLQFGATNSSL